MKEIKLNVEGMVCEWCEKRVENALKTINGVNEVIAKHESGIVTIKADNEIEKNVIEEKIEDLGFEVKED